MFIQRDLTKRPVTDFVVNVKPKLNDKLIAEEVYNDRLLVGWQIIRLTK
jgi:hypothetical protein